MAEKLAHRQCQAGQRNKESNFKRDLIVTSPGIPRSTICVVRSGHFDICGGGCAGVVTTFEHDNFTWKLTIKHQ